MSVYNIIQNGLLLLLVLQKVASDYPSLQTDQQRYILLHLV